MAGKQKARSGPRRSVSLLWYAFSTIAFDVVAYSIATRASGYINFGQYPYYSQVFTYYTEIDSFVAKKLNLLTPYPYYLAIIGVLLLFTFFAGMLAHWKISNKAKRLHEQNL